MDSDDDIIVGENYGEIITDSDSDSGCEVGFDDETDVESASGDDIDIAQGE